jgi:hypothetical protein
MSWFSLKVKSDMKTNIAKTDTQIAVMKQLAEKDDNKRELQAIEKENKELRNSLGLVSDMLVELTKNVNVDPEVKEKIESMGNKAKYGTGLEIIKELELKNQKLAEELKASKDALIAQTKPIVTTAKEVVKKIRK